MSALSALLRGCRPTQPPKPKSPPPPTPSTPPPTTAPPTTFSTLPAALQSALSTLQILSPTAVQTRAIPHIPTHDVLAIAPTGSGKTLAYLLPLLSLPTSTAPTSLIIAPTRELADQICRVAVRVVKLARLKIKCIALTTASVAGSLANVDLLIATPLRLQSALDAARVNLNHVQHLVLDEADELLTDKFLSQIDSLIAECATPRVHMFSATLPGHMQHLAASLLKTPKRIIINAGAYGGAAAINDVATHIDQQFLFVGGSGEQGKVLEMRRLLRTGLKPPVLLFVQTKERAAQLFRELIYDGIPVDAIHSSRTAAARSRAIARFRSGELWLLITTDVLARGMDFRAVNTVVSYDIPGSASAYVHRIGRTGRNGRCGKAVTLFTEEDRLLVGGVVRVAVASGVDVPPWMTRLGGRKDEVRRLETRPARRKKVGGGNRERLGGKRKRVEGGLHKDNEDGEGEEGNKKAAGNEVKKGDNVQGRRDSLGSIRRRKKRKVSKS